MPDSPSLIERFPALTRLALGARRRRIPVVRQLAFTDCGPAALAMVLGYYGKQVSLSEISQAVGAGRDGSSAAGLLRVARSFGLRGRAVRLDLDELEQLPAGTILHWNFRHYVVLEKLHRDRADVVDPGFGRRSVPMHEFRRAFTGVALLLEPTAEFERGGSRPKRLSGLLRQVLERKDLIGRIVTVSLLVQLLSAVMPLLTALLIDRVVPHKDYSLLLVLALGYVLFQGFNAFSAFMRAYLLIYLRADLDVRFSLRFLDHLIDLPYSFFQKHTSGDLMVRLGINNTVREILTSSALSAVMDGTMASVYLVVLFLSSPKLTLIIVLLAFARLTLMMVIRWRQRQLLAETLEYQGRSQTYEVEMLSGMETLKVMGIEHRAAERWTDLFVDRLNITIRRGRLDALFSALLSLLGTATTLALMFYGAFLVLKGDLTLGTMMAISALAAGFLTPLDNLLSAGLQFQMLEVYVERLNEVIETPPEQDNSAVVFSGPLEGAITLENVSFRYDNQGPLAIDEVSIEVRPGMRIALVGRTGSGKSTLARLMAGLYEPCTGRILFDGHDLKTLDRRSVRSQLGAVTQDTQLFGGSIRSNICLSDPQMGLEQVVHAAQVACIHEDILRMGMGYETVLMDRGLSLSGGQRQRLALARAVAGNPKVLILDEATSHLDVVTEQQVIQNLASLRCTQIVIAHQLSTIRDADLIVVMEQGRIVEQGTHDALMLSGGTYAALVGSHHELQKSTTASAL